jgi:hypothetical protein
VGSNESTMAASNARWRSASRAVAIDTAATIDASGTAASFCHHQGAVRAMAVAIDPPARAAGCLRNTLLPVSCGAG